MRRDELDANDERMVATIIECSSLAGYPTWPITALFSQRRLEKRENHLAERTMCAALTRFAKRFSIVRHDSKTPRQTLGVFFFFGFFSCMPVKQIEFSRLLRRCQSKRRSDSYSNWTSLGGIRRRSVVRCDNSGPPVFALVTHLETASGYSL